MTHAAPCSTQLDEVGSKSSEVEAKFYMCTYLHNFASALIRMRAQQKQEANNESIRRRGVTQTLAKELVLLFLECTRSKVIFMF